MLLRVMEVVVSSWWRGGDGLLRMWGACSHTWAFLYIVAVCCRLLLEHKANVEAVDHDGVCSWLGSLVLREWSQECGGGGICMSGCDWTAKKGRAALRLQCGCARMCADHCYVRQWRGVHGGGHAT